MTNPNLFGLNVILKYIVIEARAAAQLSPGGVDESFYDGLFEIAQGNMGDVPTTAATLLAFLPGYVDAFGLPAPAEVGGGVTAQPADETVNAEGSPASDEDDHVEGTPINPVPSVIHFLGPETAGTANTEVSAPASDLEPVPSSVCRTPSIAPSLAPGFAAPTSITPSSTLTSTDRTLSAIFMDSALSSPRKRSREPSPEEDDDEEPASKRPAPGQGKASCLSNPRNPLRRDDAFYGEAELTARGAGRSGTTPRTSVSSEDTAHHDLRPLCRRSNTPFVSNRPRPLHRTSRRPIQREGAFYGEAQSMAGIGPVSPTLSNAASRSSQPFGGQGNILSLSSATQTQPRNNHPTIRLRDGFYGQDELITGMGGNPSAPSTSNSSSAAASGSQSTGPRRRQPLQPHQQLNRSDAAPQPPTQRRGTARPSPPSRGRAPSPITASPFAQGTPPDGSFISPFAGGPSRARKRGHGVDEEEDEDEENKPPMKKRSPSPFPETSAVPSRPTLRRSPRTSKKDPSSHKDSDDRHHDRK